MDKTLDLNQTWKKAEATRMELVNKINAKRKDKLSFTGDMPLNFIKEYNNLVDEHNTIALAQKSIKDKMSEYVSMSGDESFNPKFNNFGLFKKLPEQKSNADGKGKKFFKRLGTDVATGGLSEVAKNKKLLQELKTFNLAPVRIAVLGLFAINLWGIASSIYAWKDKEPEKYNKVRDDWYKLGGNRDKFDKNVKKGGNKKPLRLFLKKNIIKSFDGEEEKLGVVADTAAMITAGGSVLTAMVKSVSSLGGKVDPEADNLPPISPEDQAALDATKKAVESGILDPEKEDRVKRNITIGIISTVLVAGIITTIILIKKHKKTN